MVTMKIWLILAICIVIGTAALSGCVEQQQQQKQIEVKDTFEALYPCGYASSTGYYVVDKAGETYMVASTCNEMDYYDEWSELKPGDIIYI